MATLATDGEGHEGWAGLQGALDTRGEDAEANRRLLAALVGERGLAEAEQLAVSTVNVSPEVAAALTGCLERLELDGTRAGRTGTFRHAHILADCCGRTVNGYIKGKSGSVAIVEKDWRLLTRSNLRAATASLRVGSGATVAYPPSAFHLAMCFADPEAAHESIRSDISGLCEGGVLLAVCPSTVVDGELAELRKTFEGMRIVGATRVGLEGASRMPATDFIVAVRDMDAPQITAPRRGADPASVLFGRDDVIGTLLREDDGLAHVESDLPAGAQARMLENRLFEQMREATESRQLQSVGRAANPAVALGRPKAAEQVDYEVDRDRNVWLVEPDGIVEKVADGGTERAERIAGAVELARDADQLLTLESMRNTSDEEVLKGIAALATKHEEYMARFGPLVEGAMKRDISAATRSAFVLRHLEVTDAHGNYARRGGILERRMLWPHADYPEHVEDVDEALSISLEQTGGVTIGIIAGLMGVDEEEAERRLGFRVLHDPDSGDLIYAEDYLVGDLGGKLDHVRELVAQRTDDGLAEAAGHWRDHVVGVPELSAQLERYLFGVHHRGDDKTPYDVFRTDLYPSLIGTTQRSAGIFRPWVDRLFHRIETTSRLPLLAALEAQPGAWDPVLAPQAHDGMMELISSWRTIEQGGARLMATAAVACSPACEEDLLRECVRRLHISHNNRHSRVFSQFAEAVGCRPTVEAVTKELMENPAAGEWVLSQHALLERNGEQHLGTAEDYRAFKARRDAFVVPHEVTGDVSDLLEVERRLVEALPPRLEKKDIVARLGAPWIPAAIYLKFIEENMLSDRATASGLRQLSIVYDDQTNNWTLRYADSALSEEARQRWSLVAEDANSASAFRLMENAMRGTATTITRTVGEGDEARQRVDEELTLLAADKRGDLETAFSHWLWRDPGRAAAMVERYNTLVNRHVGRKVDGSYLRLPDVADGIALMGHQKDAVARVLRSSEGTLLAHAVGAGKTFEGAVAVHESKRLGKCRKPLVAVPNSVVGQWANEWARIYPMDRVLVMDAAASRNEDARQRFWDVARGGDWDAVIVPKSQFDRMELSPARVAQELRAEIERYDALLKNDEGPALTSRARKSFLTGSRNRCWKELHNLRYDTTAACFDSLGFDMLVVDEAHHYKHLGIKSSMSVAGIDRVGTAAARNLLRFCGYLRSEGKGSNIVFLTGTPVTNSVTELYVMQRFLAPRSLDSLGVLSFDNWAKTFGQVNREVELKPEGGLQLKERFSRFSNLPELMASVHEWCDLVTNDDLNLRLPEVHVVNVDVPATAEQRMCMRWLEGRGEAVRDGKVTQSVDNMLAITSDGKKVALDPKLLFAEDEHVQPMRGGKVDKCADNVLDVYLRTTRSPEGELVNGVQLVFCDTSTDKEAWNVQRDLKDRLVLRGIPERQIATVPGSLTPAKREAIFRLARAGEIRVLIGSTNTLGTGVSVQERLAAIHDLDCPWRSSDLEQRLGRIRRQGNCFASCGWFTPVDYRYATVGTFDAYLYQTTARKGAFVSQVMTNDSPLREAAELSDAVLTLSEMKALASGNPAVRRRLELENEVKSLQLKRGAWQRELDAAKGRKADIEERLGFLRAATTGHEEFCAAVKQMLAESEAREGNKRLVWPVTVGGETFEPKDGWDWLTKAETAMWRQAKEHVRPCPDLPTLGEQSIWKVGKLGPLDLSLLYEVGSGAATRPCPVLSLGTCMVKPNEPPLNPLDAALRLVANAEQHVQRNVAEVAYLENGLASLEARLDSQWPLEGNLARRQAELDALPLNEGDALSHAHEYPHLADVYAALTTGRLVDLGDAHDPMLGYEGRERPVEVRDFEVVEARA